jgi:hypothetical protein
MERLCRRNPDVAPCRLCGGEGLREHCWICRACYDAKGWPFILDQCPVDAYTPTIHAILDARARREATRIKSPCSIEDCENKVPTPEGIREDAICDEDYAILFGESRLDRRSMMGQRY